MVFAVNCREEMKPSHVCDAIASHDALLVMTGEEEDETSRALMMSMSAEIEFMASRESSYGTFAESKQHAIRRDDTTNASCDVREAVVKCDHSHSQSLGHTKPRGTRRRPPQRVMSYCDELFALDGRARR